MHIPTALDNPYIVQLYTAWVLLKALALHGMLFSLCRQRNSGIYHECKSYIEAISADISQHCPLVRALLDRCKFLSQGLAKPDHLYSHRKGTFLDEILGMLDEKAKFAANQQRRSLGSIADLQPPQALWRLSVDVCPFCASPNVGNHILDTCPLTDFVHWYLHIKVSLWLPEVVPQWKDCTPTPWGG